MNSDESPEPSGPQPVKLALGLGLMLLLVVLGLNALDSAGRPVERAVFAGLVESNAVEEIQVYPGQGLSALTQGERVWVEGAPTPEEVDLWRGQGLLGEMEKPNYGGLAFLGLGLVAGLVYLFFQARTFRRFGSPRQELQDLEDARARGDIDDEEYQRRSEAAWGKM